MFDKVLIANRGAIAVRIMRTLRQMGIRSVAVYAESDRDSKHLRDADEVYCLGPGRAADTYLNQAKLIEVIHASGTEAVHPGYGFLSESADFASLLAKEGITFIGPRPEHLLAFGLKHEARKLATAAGVSLLPGSGIVASAAEAATVAATIGYPVMLKSTAGGGGIGMTRCMDEPALLAAFESVARLAQANFGNAEMFVEKLVAKPRHVEVQALGDGTGNVMIIGDRDCSLQRRHQKVIEECPAPGLPDTIRAQLHKQAEALLASVKYQSAGTVEFLYDAGEANFWFLEVNTRLQVEHGVTEMVYGVDLVEAMIKVAAGDTSYPAAGSLTPHGHAVQARVYAEDPAHDFRPTPGFVAHVAFPTVSETLRVDTWLESGTSVSPFFDPMLAKIISHADSRAEALELLGNALHGSVIHGIETNLDYLGAALDLPQFVAEKMTTASLDGLDYAPVTVELVDGGASTTIQAFPGRQGYWSVGVPPSGPMDDLSFRLGNRLLGNAADAAGLEIVMRGPVLQFNADATVVVAGPETAIDLDGEPKSAWQTIPVGKGQQLNVGQVQGVRAYLLIGGGFNVPAVLGSTATFTLGAMGGHGGRALRAGDTLHISQTEARPPGAGAGSTLAPGQVPDYQSRNEVRILMGPHTAPDFFTEAGVDTFLNATWTVHYNSSRTGVRLTGPQPEWAREDGGEAGLHPSNIHDNAYAFGSIDFTGDMPVILGPDGPSLGGFVCPGVVINADRWKLGQLTPGDKIHFVPVSEADAATLTQATERWIAQLGNRPSLSPTTPVRSPFVTGGPWPDKDSDVVIRRAGQEWLLVEFGPHTLDIGLRLRAHAFGSRIKAAGFGGIVEMTAGIRSLQIRYDTNQWDAEKLARALGPLLDDVRTLDNEIIESRIVHLPLSWDDPACREAVSRYVQGVRPDAPWCPDNIEFIRRINGLAHVDDVKKIVFDASYLVMGLGDVYLGAPVATPLDPRHRLVTTKYNPARTWTAENSVGIGGSYLCVYGMEGPGGYQFVGRTVQVWNQHCRGADFDEPWLLRPFDQIRFFEVSAETLLEMREAFPRGELELDIEPTQFDFGAYRAFLAENKTAINTFRKSRQQAFEAELARWREAGLLTFESDAEGDQPAAVSERREGAVESPMAGSVWSIKVKDNEEVQVGDVLLVLEAMKSEFEVTATRSGKVELLVGDGQIVQAGQALAVVTQ